MHLGEIRRSAHIVKGDDFVVVRIRQDRANQKIVQSMPRFIRAVRR